MRERELFTAIIQSPLVETVDRHARVFVSEGELIAREYEESAGRKHRAVREGVGNAVGKFQTARLVSPRGTRPR